MGAPFSDITIYNPTPYTAGTPEYAEERALINFVSDFYVQNMGGYKPPKTSRITIQPAYHKDWGRTWKNGSIVAIAPFFSHEEFSSLEKSNKYKYILDLIQTATIQLSEEYNWDRKVFEIAYNKTLASNFNFRIQYPLKQSRDRKKTGSLIVTKTETITSVYVEIDMDRDIKSRKLFDKKNLWCYDCVYYLAKNSKWFDNDRFGIGFGKGKIDIWHSLSEDTVRLFEYGKPVAEVNYSRFFLLN